MRRLLGIIMFSVIIACVLASIVRNERVDLTSIYREDVQVQQVYLDESN